VYLFFEKNVIQYYRQYNSPVFSCFLDASRAFDRINYWSLFENLPDTEFLCWLLDYYAFGTTYKSFV